jgi:hypothetical protein
MPEPQQLQQAAAVQAMLQYQASLLQASHMSSCGQAPNMLLAPQARPVPSTMCSRGLQLPRLGIAWQAFSRLVTLPMAGEVSTRCRYAAVWCTNLPLCGPGRRSLYAPFK